MDRLSQAFKLLADAGVSLKASKCHLSTQEVEYLGRRLRPAHCNSLHVVFLVFQRQFKMQEIQADACIFDTKNGQREGCDASYTMCISSRCAPQCKLDCGVKHIELNRPLQCVSGMGRLTNPFLPVLVEVLIHFGSLF